MIVVPIEESILYVEPIYIASSNQSTLPELKQVVVAYNEKIVMKSSLDEAIYALFNEKAPQKNPDSAVAEPETSETLGYEDVAKKIIEEFKRVKTANAENDWSGFGESMKALEQSITDLEESISSNEE